MSAQEKAFNAIVRNDKNELLEAIKEGAKLTLSPKGLLPPDNITFKDIENQSLAGRALINALGSKYQYIELLETIRKTKIDFAVTWIQAGDIERAKKSKIPELIGFIVDFCLDLDEDWQKHFTLHQAASEGNTRMVKTLVKLGAKIDRVDEEGRTPLMVCASRECMEAIFESYQRPDLDITDHKGHTAIWHAVHNTIKTIKKRERRDNQIEYKDVSGMLFLMEKNDLESDPHAISLARIITRRMTKGFVVHSGTTVIHDPLKDIFPQLKTLQSIDSRNKLERLLRKSKKRESKDLTQTRLRM